MSINVIVSKHSSDFALTIELLYVIKINCLSEQEKKMQRANECATVDRICDYHWMYIVFVLTENSTDKFLYLIQCSLIRHGGLGKVLKQKMSPHSFIGPKTRNKKAQNKKRNKKETIKLHTSYTIVCSIDAKNILPFILVKLHTLLF